MEQMNSPLLESADELSLALHKAAKPALSELGTQAQVDLEQFDDLLAGVANGLAKGRELSPKVDFAASLFYYRPRMVALLKADDASVRRLATFYLLLADSLELSLSGTLPTTSTKS